MAHRIKRAATKSYDISGGYAFAVGAEKRAAANIKKRISQNSITA